MERTFHPSWAKIGETCRPTNPLAPVTRTVGRSLCIDLASIASLYRDDHAALEPNSGTASFKTALIVVGSCLSIACSSAAIHLRSACIGGSFGFAAITP